MYHGFIQISQFHMLLKNKSCKYFETERQLKSMNQVRPHTDHLDFVLLKRNLARSICSAELSSKLDEFVEPFADLSCYTVLDLYSEYDGCKLHLKSRDLTTFSSSLGLL